MSGEAAPLLRCRGITKRFGSLVANDAIDFDARAGEVHAIVGENGAGKSTFMNVLYGMLQPDAGSFELDGREVRFASCAQAMRAGIGMVFQHYLLVERFTVAENVMLGRERTRRGFIDRHADERAVAEIAERYRFRVDPATTVETLGVGARQQVELLKVLERDPKIIILDEPTAALSPFEIEGLFEVVRRLRSQGRTVIFITHKLKEVIAISDRVTVLRRGKVVGDLTTSQTDESTLGTIMVGREQARDASVLVATAGSASALRVHDLILIGDPKGRNAPLSFEVRCGELVAIAGVEGNGQLELAETLYGMRTCAAGSIELGDRDITRAKTVERRGLGLRYVAADRQREGLVLDFDVVENMLLGDQRLGESAMMTDLGTARERSDEVAQHLWIARYDRSAAMRNYSGGTQQKFLVGRETGIQARVVIAFAPTRGVDIGAAQAIYRRLRDLQARGAGIILISYDLDEIRTLANRILVMSGWAIAGELAVDAADDATLGRLMGGSAA
jgi:ABC-type uncharacterized transport system ATPase subunit